ncbi:hemolysin family protein [Marseilla massiliensis]|jgi:putative hemolysin|uniref:HlyC/CorC family transporter n=1 Tax=Marseilla massiliensis TaxID=1841864 RepID=A0A939B460_9BACT|nr:hemolysin family protein [Marseilla massiliensis]MBM6661089.1 HlyC/CorC family transporter [Marseilla massiliensis]MCL1609756.1 hemolysin family protein [Marseilla massiliensis]MEE0361225.1 hemolysin family protein [Prevotella sp.]
MDEIFIIIGLILLNGVFAMSEIALISARKSSLSTDADSGLRSARYALKLAKEPDRFLSTVQIGITLIGILTGIYSGNKVAVIFSEWLAGIGVTSHYASVLSQAIIVIVVTYLTLIFGELVPKRIGLTVAEKAAKLVAVPMYGLSLVAYPFVWLLSKSTSLIFSLTGLKDKGSKVTEEEIKSIIREGAEDGEVQPMEQDIMRRVFLVGDLEVDAIMTHRSEITWLDCSMTANEVREIIKENMYAVYPVAEGDLDHVKGIVSIKDLFLTLGNNDFDLRKIMHKPTYFYENTDVYKVLEDMKAQHISTGLVCDEFGSCIGIITLNDILESLVGTVQEPAEEEPYIIPRKEGEEWFVDGQCPMYDFLSYFGEEDLLDDEDYNTVAGLCLFQLDHVPDCGETFVWESFKFEVIDMDGARIDKLLVTRVKEPSKEQDD